MIFTACCERTASAGSEHSQLVSKCQENGWLKVGGYDWQDDPFLEEYPYEFMRIDDIDALREHFERGNWAIRQGVVFDDLAFINQVNGGDEWWTLKRDGEEWAAFESTSFAYVIEAKGRAAFETLVRSMQLATPAQCKALDYYDKDASAKWATERNPRTPEPNAPSRSAPQTPAKPHPPEAAAATYRAARPRPSTNEEQPANQSLGQLVPARNPEKGANPWQRISETRAARSCSTGCSGSAKKPARKPLAKSAKGLAEAIRSTCATIEKSEGSGDVAAKAPRMGEAQHARVRGPSRIRKPWPT